MAPALFKRKSSEPRSHEASASASGAVSILLRIRPTLSEEKFPKLPDSPLQVSLAQNFISEPLKDEGSLQSIQLSGESGLEMNQVEDCRDTVESKDSNKKTFWRQWADQLVTVDDSLDLDLTDLLLDVSIPDLDAKLLEFPPEVITISHQHCQFQVSRHFLQFGPHR